MNRSTLTTRGRVTIPKHVRDYLGLSPGDKLRFEYAGDGTVLIVALRKPTKDAETKRSRRFLDEAARADVAMQESGVGYAMPDVHAYLAAKVRREQVKRPSPVKWRT